MMDRREALLLIERLKRRTRDPDVLALCEHFEHERVNAVAFRRPGDAVNAPTVNAPKRPPPAAIWPRICASDGRR